MSTRRNIFFEIFNRKQIFLSSKRMNATVQIPIVSPDAGDPVALSDPNSPASLAKRAREQESQSGADTLYDQPPPPRVAQAQAQGFTNYSYTPCFTDELRVTGAGLFLSLGALFLLYAVAPNPK
jgi:hypothetical protein